VVADSGPVEVELLAVQAPLVRLPTAIVRRRSDLVGADDPRISRYKSKFAPELSPFYSIEGGTRPARIAASLYQRVRK
jgi:hypothetical protein